MHTALFYPHTKLRKQDFTKTALLLWDKVNYISPFKNYKPIYKDPLLAEAAEMLAVEHVPSEEEKEQAHIEIEKLVKSNLPEWFLFKPENHNLSYEIMPEKLLPQTWRMLLETKFVKQNGTPGPVGA